MKPKVKRSELSRILSTKDYSIFEFPDVKISKRHLGWVKESILDKNLMADFPILVSDKYAILDGKYKFLACYELKLPVHYKIAEVTTLEDAIRIKEISLKTPLAQIIELYKDKDEYNNLAFIKKEFEGYFKYQDILRLIESACKKTKSTSFTTTLDRYKIASGKIGSYDPSVVINKLTSVKYLCDEFKWDTSSAIQLLKFHNFKVDYPRESKRIRWAYDVCIQRKEHKYCANSNLPFEVYLDEHNFFVREYPPSNKFL